jgi:drug/metabolite transporter (DMT)-like permease
MKTRPVDVILIFLMCLVWAGNYFVVKGALPYVDPITFAFLRASLGGIFVFLIGGFRLRRAVVRRDLVWLAFLGLFNITLFLIFLNVSLVTANPGVDSTLVYTQPILVVAMTPILGERLTLKRTGGILAAFGGIAVVFLPNILTSSFVIGDVYALGASLSWAIAVTIFKRWNTSLDAQTITFIQSSLGAVLMLPVFIFQRPFIDPTIPFWIFLGYNVILASGLAYIVYWRILSRMPATQFTSYFFLVPVLATIMSSALSLNVPAWNEIVGTVLVAAGIIVVNR